MDKNTGLTVRQKLGYGTGEMAATLFWSALGFFLLNFLTDEVGLTAGLVGIALMVGKTWDAVTDPAVGFLSDRTRTRWGKRRPWILFGAVPLGVSFFIMFNKPGFQGQTSLFIWAVLAYMFLCTMFTVVNIPYIAMVPEMTKDFDERTNLNAYRSLFSILGTLLGAGAALPIIGLFAERAQGYRAMGAIFAVIMMITALIPFFATRERGRSFASDQPVLFLSYKEALRNRQFLFVLLPFALNTTGITIVTASLIYFFKYIHHNESLLTIALVILLVTAMFCLPLAVMISGRLGKRNTYIGGILLVMASLLVLFSIGHLVPVQGVYAIMFFTGIGLSTHFVMPWSMLPDVVEFDYALNGVRREGIYYGIWTFMSKIGSAFAGFLGGTVLQLSGYIANSELTASAIWGIRLLVGPLAALFFLLSIIILRFYSIDKSRYQEICNTIRDRAD